MEENIKKRDQRKIIMIVDDDSDTTMAVKHGLEDINPTLDVIELNSGKKCMSLLELGIIPDLILLDIMMPGMCGWETFDKIKEKSNCRSVPIVFLTCRTDGYTVKHGREIGENYVEKPFEVENLNYIIEKKRRR